MPRILLITSVLPWPLRRNGGAQRTALLRDALAKHGDIDVLGIGDQALRENSPDFDRQLEEQRIVGCIVVEPKRATSRWPGPVGGLQRVVRQYASRYDVDPTAAAKLDELLRTRGYDLIVSRYLAPALQAGVDRHPSIPKLLDFDDIDYATLADSIRAKPWPGIGGRLGSRAVLSRVESICKNNLEQFRHVFVTSEEDRKLLDRHDGVSILPNIPFAEPGKKIVPLPEATESHEILFVGDLQFPPNRDGLERFISQGWQIVREAIPDATLSVVGRGLSDEDRKRWGEVAGVKVIGFAPDLVECYRRAAFTIVPVFYGGGTKIKVLESLAYGRTVATTPKAMRGYISLGRVVMTGECGDGLARACVELLKWPEERAAMVREAEQRMSAFSIERFRQVVDEAMAMVLK